MGWPEDVAEPLWRKNDGILHSAFIQVDQVSKVVVKGQKCYDFFSGLYAEFLAKILNFGDSHLLSSFSLLVQLISQEQPLDGSPFSPMSLFLGNVNDFIT